MKISIRDIEEIIEKLQELENVMQSYDINEVPTSCNTYNMYEFISFGNKGYLGLSQDELDTTISNMISEKESEDE